MLTEDTYEKQVLVAGESIIEVQMPRDISYPVYVITATTIGRSHTRVIAVRDDLEAALRTANVEAERQANETGTSAPQLEQTLVLQRLRFNGLVDLMPKVTE